MNNNENYKKCKKCGALIPFKANKCKYCGKIVKVDTTAIVMLVVALWLFFGVIIIGFNNDNNSENDIISTTEIAVTERTQIESELQTEIITSVDNLDETEYKANCKELYYDDVFLEMKI